MRFGRHLRELWRIRWGVALCALVAAVASLLSVASIHFQPLRLSARQQEMAAASTRVFVDAPKPSVLDLAVSLNDFDSMEDRALLIGNVMATAPVKAYIARRAGVAPERLDISSPVTPDWPRELAVNGIERHTTDIVKSPDQYRISIQVNPTVPIVDVYAVAPKVAVARRLAGAVVTGMQDYLAALATARRVPPRQQVRLEPLGRPTGGLIDAGVSRKLAVLTFLLVFAACALTLVLFARVRLGWALEAASEPSRLPAAAPDPAP